MKFSKYHGLGNDFILVDRPEIDGSDAIKLCDRRRGVGADGVLVVTTGQKHPFAMKVLNADGSVAEMCGNGLRCVVSYLHSRYEHLPSRYQIETGAGPLWVEYTEDGISADLGAAQDLGLRTIDVNGRSFSGRLISTGNPHFVIYSKVSRNERETLGPKLAIHPHFIHGANISFAAVTEAGQIDLVVWERGCGFTQACGTGACATAVVGWLDGHIRPGPVRVNLPGGALEISGTAESVTMRGPAVHVYDGQWLGIP